MNIITLFCEIDDFFLAYEKWQATQSLPMRNGRQHRVCRGLHRWKHADVREGYIRAR